MSFAGRRPLLKTLVMQWSCCKTQIIFHNNLRWPTVAKLNRENWSQNQTAIARDEISLKALLLTGSTVLTTTFVAVLHITPPKPLIKLFIYCLLIDFVAHFIQVEIHLGQVHWLPYVDISEKRPRFHHFGEYMLTITVTVIQIIIV